MSSSLSLDAPALGPAPRDQVVSLGLWIFMAVVCSLFGLFLAAYVMRLSEAEGYPLALPWQFWLSTGLLTAGSIALHLAAGAARAGRGAQLLWRLGGVCAAGFVVVQLWGWESLASAQVLPRGNPAASFLFVLTGLHGLHVVGGVVSWWWVARGGQKLAAWRIALCARYWHFLLALWLVLYAVLGLMTPDIVRAICSVVQP